ncbi:penicillin-binding transpeptidase domain-containing protein [Granulicatella sp. zg-84]|uniref:penicillin-binding transpeptidase domain-containing protein n=1 Tax=Granulicatella sp. zg-84 TaxID=2678503 RepID=UPI0013C2282F|nr:penicillin-binding transpeptidase domain-containing protein [Granulicatella sp. zg-84]NEW66661.1 PASTA domain-containing protein [Granulicatella sp. zg-84]
MKRIKNLIKTDSIKMVHIYMAFLCVVFIVFLVRFTQLMVFKTANGEDLTKLVHQMYNGDEVIPARRGTIYDASGETLATDVKTYAIYAVLTDKYKGVEYVEDKLATARALAKHINMSEDNILKLLNQDNVNQTAFGNAGVNLTYLQKENIEKESLKGIYFTEKISRDYPKGYYANNVIGLAKDTREDTSVEAQGNPLQGVMGLEAQYNVQLRGIDGLVNYDKDFYGYSVPGTQKVIEEVQNGNNIYTTFDSRLTEYLEEQMSKIYEKYKPKSMTAIVVRPKTGDVVAVSQRPTFNPKQQEYPENGWINQIVERAFEPGSTMKTLVLAAAINEGVFSPMELYDSGKIKVGSIVVNDWNRTGWGRISYLQGLIYSSNVAFVNIVSQIGYDKWKEYMDAFGIGRSTESGFPNENVGLNSYASEEGRASTGFGQGVSVTSLQLVQAFTAIANEGKMQKLRFVDRIENTTTGEVTYTKVQTLSNPIKPETAKWVLKYLEEVIYAENATGENYKVDGVRLAGKTGTAEIYDEEKKTYLTDGNYLHSIVAFVPSEKPEYVIYFTYDRPESSRTSSLGLSEWFTTFTSYAMKYLGKDEAPESQKAEVVPSATGADVETAKEALKNIGFTDIIVLGNGTIIEKQAPLDNQLYTLDTKLILYTGGIVTLPDMTGWSKLDVMKVMNLLNIPVNFEGEGFVSEQSIPSGVDVSTITDTVNITLTSPTVKSTAIKNTSDKIETTSTTKETE